MSNSMSRETPMRIRRWKKRKAPETAEIARMTAAKRITVAAETERLNASIALPTTPGAASETPVDRTMQSVPAAMRPAYGRKNPKKAARSFTREVYRAAPSLIGRRPRPRAKRPPLAPLLEQFAGVVALSGREDPADLEEHRHPGLREPCPRLLDVVDPPLGFFRVDLRLLHGRFLEEPLLLEVRAQIDQLRTGAPEDRFDPVHLRFRQRELPDDPRVLPPLAVERGAPRPRRREKHENGEPSLHDLPSFSSGSGAIRFHAAPSSPSTSRETSRSRASSARSRASIAGSARGAGAGRDAVREPSQNAPARAAAAARPAPQARDRRFRGRGRARTFAITARSNSSVDASGRPAISRAARSHSANRRAHDPQRERCGGSGSGSPDGGKASRKRSPSVR